MDIDWVVKGLNRLANDQKIEGRSRNVIREAVTFIREQQEKIDKLESEIEGMHEDEAGEDI